MASKNINMAKWVAFIVAAVAIAYMAFSAGAWFALDIMYQQQSANISDDVYVLERIREGDVNAAITRIEGDLNSNIISLIYRDYEGSEYTQNSITDSLYYAKEYREKHPNDSNSETDRAVGEILSGLGDRGK